MTWGPNTQISPTPFTGNSLPASSRIEMSVEGMGRPMEPLKSSPTGLAVATGEVSVNPQPWVTTQPVTSFQRAATTACTAMPPAKVTRSAPKSTDSNPGVCSSALSSVLTPLMKLNLYFFQFGDEGLEVARIGDQDVPGAQGQKGQAIAGEREDVVQRQRRDDDARLSGLQPRIHPGGRLQHIGHHVAVGENRGLGNAGKAMSCGPRGTGSSSSPRPPPRALFESRRARHAPGGDLLAHMPQHEIDDGAARPAEQISDARDQHSLQIRTRQRLLQHVREILDDDDDLGAGILQLMFELARGVQRVGVDDHHARAQHAEERDRVLQDIGHHQGDPIALDQPGFVLQPGGECTAELIELGKAQGGAHVGESRQMPMGGTGLFEYVPQGGIAVGVDVRRHSGWVLVQPISIQAATPRFSSACIAPVTRASNEQTRGREHTWARRRPAG